MAALHRDDRSSGGRRRNWLLGLAPTPGTPKGVPDAATLSEEVEVLRERLAVAERRAAEAEMALPHLLGLGQRTVNGLLDDARARGREIIEEARARAAAELDEQREATRREARELDALRMAVAAEAMGLESIRAELQRRISLSAEEIARIAHHPMLLGEPLKLEQAGIHPVPPAAISSPTVRPLPSPGEVLDVRSGADDPGMGLVEASVMEATAVEAQIEIADAMVVEADSSGVAESPAAVAEGAAPTEPAVPATGFAAAWAADEDESVSEAFERFFTAEVDHEPSRDWILADDTKP